MRMVKKFIWKNNRMFTIIGREFLFSSGFRYNTTAFDDKNYSFGPRNFEL
jgi:hypothetical protein